MVSTRLCVNRSTRVESFHWLLGGGGKRVGRTFNSSLRGKWLIENEVRQFSPDAASCPTVSYFRKNLSLISTKPVPAFNFLNFLFPHRTAIHSRYARITEIPSFLQFLRQTVSRSTLRFLPLSPIHPTDITASAFSCSPLRQARTIKVTKCV